MTVSPQAIGFLGAGQMATALARAWREAGCLDPERSWAADPLEAARERIAQAAGLRTTPHNREVAAACPILVVAVKPPAVPEVLAEVREEVSERHCVISIAAGVTLQQIDQALGGRGRLIRVMPNTPCLVGAGAAAFASGPRATPADGALCERLFTAVGYCCPVPESLLDAVTALSGSGPAFVAVLLEALADGGVLCGLPRELAMRLAAQTVLGTAQLVLQEGRHPALVKDAVASPGGTTIAGLHVLERAGVRGAIQEAVAAAAARARELARPTH